MPAVLARVTTVVGFALFVPVGILYLASGLVVPMPWLVAVWALGVARLAYAVWRRRDPWHVFATPFVAVALWVAIVSAGDVFLDWTA